MMTYYHTFTDENSLSAGEKQQLLDDWRRFIHGGFKKIFFTDSLYQLLRNNCEFMAAHYGRESFWRYYFEAEVPHLRAFIAQFGDSRHLSAEAGTQGWLQGQAADLKAAMCREMELIYEPVNCLLDDLARQHNQLAQAWYEFAHAAGLAGLELPPGYIITENSRNLLAYCIRVALKEQRRLTGLQTRFPVPLLYPEPETEATYAPAA